MVSTNRTSWLRMTESRPPEERVLLFQARALTREAWPLRLRICLHRSASQIWTVAEAVPTEMCLPAGRSPHMHRVSAWVYLPCMSCRRGGWVRIILVMRTSGW